MRASSVLVIVAALAACGGQTTGGGARPSLTGTVAGKPVTPMAEGVGLVGLFESGSGGASSYAGTILTNLQNTCSILEQGGNPANATALSLTVATAVSRSGVPTGTYPILLSPTGPGATAPTTQASAQYVAQDARCTSTTDETATGGSITLTRVSDSLVAGSFDVTFPSGDHLTGTFSSPVCDAAIGGQGQAQPACKAY